MASPLACLIEDAPSSESLQWQAVEIACLIEHPELCEGEDDRELSSRLVPVSQQPAYVDLMRINDNVAYACRFNGKLVAVYAGGNSKRKTLPYKWILMMDTTGFEPVTSTMST